MMIDSDKRSFDAVLSGWKKLIREATPGPWSVAVARTRMFRQQLVLTRDGSIRIPLVRHTIHHLQQAIANAAFIAGARAALPRLIEEVHRLRGENDQLREQLQAMKTRECDGG